jgi:hypothetical protein
VLDGEAFLNVATSAWATRGTMSGIDSLIAKGFVDKAKVGVMG